MDNLEKKNLYDRAKEAYFNGEPIMSDYEFDTLESELGLENNSYIGTHHQKSYTIKHPFIMGSLSKIQIKENNDNTISWGSYVDCVKSYLFKSNNTDSQNWYYEVGPKYDGCSFEVVIDKYMNLISVSTRGDGTYGKDIKPWFEVEWEKNFMPKLGNFFSKNLDEHERFFLDKFVVRGECLVKKSVFKQKYADTFTIPRSFVSGCLNREWENTPEQIEMRNDLFWICYDYREIFNNSIKEIDYTPMSDPIMKKYLPDYSCENLPGVSAYGTYGFMSIFKSYTLTPDNFKKVYEMYDSYRKYDCDFELDGFVIKPGPMFRIQDTTRERQEDCVAIKFIPEIVDATLIDIEWNVGKTGEYYPTGILEPIILGGKSVNRVSLSNYGKIIKDGLGIGSRLRVRLSGDIIPDVIGVTKKSNTITIPDDSYIDGVHLMKNLTMKEKTYIKFINSVNVLKPDGIGEKVAEKLYQLNPCQNILWLMIDIPLKDLSEKLDNSRSSQNIITALRERRKTLTLPDVIQSFGYENCGEKNALWLAKKFSGLNPDSKGIPESIITLSENKTYIDTITDYINYLNVPLLKEDNNNDKIPVILTGSPKEFGYKTKSDFLIQHPQYVETTKWDECRILFTDDLNSTSSKMSKAKKLGIDIKIYNKI